MNEADDGIPPVVAVTVIDPASVVAVIPGEVAIPKTLVVTVAGPLNVTLGPVPGAVNVTATPAMGLPNASDREACRGQRTLY
jgi:hypothetical protein